VTSFFLKNRTVQAKTSIKKRQDALKPFEKTNPGDDYNEG